MDVDSLLAFVRFHAWANDRILTTAAGLPGRGVPTRDGSRRQCLPDAPTSRRRRLELARALHRNDVGKTYVWDHGFELDDLPAIHAFCLEKGHSPAELRGVPPRQSADRVGGVGFRPGRHRPALVDRRPCREPRDAASQRATSRRVRALGGRHRPPGCAPRGVAGRRLIR